MEEILEILEENSRYSDEQIAVMAGKTVEEISKELNIEVLFDETILQDFTYVNNGDGTYSLTGWKGTKNGISSTEIVIPDNDAIIW